MGISEDQRKEREASHKLKELIYTTHKDEKEYVFISYKSDDLAIAFSKILDGQSITK